MICAECQSKEEAVHPLPVATPATTKVEPSFETKTLLQDPIDVVLVETPTEALRSWRTFQSAKPTLVLLSKDPFSATVPSELISGTLHLLQQGSDQDLLDRLSYSQSNPLFLPIMASSAAMEAGFFPSWPGFFRPPPTCKPWTRLNFFNSSRTLALSIRPKRQP